MLGAGRAVLQMAAGIRVIIDMTGETELVRRAKEGDVPAFEALYRLYNNRIYNFAKQVTGSAEDAGDVVQDTFVRAWHALPGMRSDSALGAWLHRIALNRSHDLMHKKRRELGTSLDAAPLDGDVESVQIQIAADAPSPEEALVAGEVQSAVRRAVDSLKPEHRLVVTMHHFEGMDVASIASVLGISRGTVMSRLSRAREALRRKLSPYVERT
jgi:RNA polymerase sigma-70 factor (ECF subfamily)